MRFDYFLHMCGRSGVYAVQNTVRAPFEIFFDCAICVHSMDYSDFVFVNTGDGHL